MPSSCHYVCLLVLLFHSVGSSCISGCLQTHHMTSYDLELILLLPSFSRAEIVIVQHHPGLWGAWIKTQALGMQGKHTLAPSYTYLKFYLGKHEYLSHLLTDNFIYLFICGQCAVLVSVASRGESRVSKCVWLVNILSQNCLEIKHNFSQAKDMTLMSPEARHLEGAQ